MSTAGSLYIITRLQHGLTWEVANLIPRQLVEIEVESLGLVLPEVISNVYINGVLGNIVAITL